MPEDTTISEALERVIKTTPSPDDPDSHSIQSLLWLIMFEGTSNLRRKKLDELKKLTTAQSEINFLNNLRRIFTLGADETGAFAVNDDLRNLLSKVAEPGSEGLMQLLDDLGLPFQTNYDKTKFTQLFADIDALSDDPAREALQNKLASLGISRDRAPTTEELTALTNFIKQSENSDLRQQLVSHQLLTTKDSFSKVERENFIESIRLTVEQKSTLNEMSIQSVTRMDTEIDQMRQYVIMAGKTYSDVLKEIARKTGGR